MKPHITFSKRSFFLLKVVLCNVFLLTPALYGAADVPVQEKETVGKTPGAVAKNVASKIKERVKFLGQWEDSKIGLEIKFSDAVKLSAIYNVGFAGAGDINFGFSQAEAGIIVNVSGVDINALPVIKNVLAKNAPQALDVVEKITVIPGDVVFLLKMISLFASAALNKKFNPGKFPQPQDILVEVNELIVRLLQTKDAQGNYIRGVSDLVKRLPDVIKNAIESLKIPNMLDKKTYPSDEISLLTFLDLRIQDVFEIQRRKFEFDPGYTDEMKAQDTDKTIKLSIYDSLKRLIAILLRARKQAETVGINYLLTNTKKVSDQVAADYGTEKQDQMRVSYRAFVEAKNTYDKAKTLPNFKTYQIAKTKLAGFIFRYVKLPLAGTDRTETALDFIVREIKKLAPQSPAFEKLKPILDPILDPLGIKLELLLADQEIPEPAIPATSEDDITMLSIEANPDDF